MRSLCIVLAGIAMAVAAVVAARAQVRPSCVEVMSEVHRNIRKRGGRPPGAAAVADQLHADVVWVERCMRSYGRVPADRSRTSGAARERLEAAIEEGEPLYRDPDAPDVQPKPRRERERRLHPKVEPTPDPFVNEFGEVRER